MSQLTDSTITDALDGVTSTDIDQFADHIANLSNEQIRAQWHLGDGPDADAVISLARRLQSVSSR